MFPQPAERYTSWAPGALCPVLGCDVSCQWPSCLLLSWALGSGPWCRTLHLPQLHSR